MDVDSKLSFLLNIGFEVRHFEVVVNPVNNEIRKPGVLALRLKQPAEELEAVLAEIVSEYLKGHERLVLCEGLSEKCQSHIINAIVGHVDVHETLVHRNGLGDRLRAVVGALVVGQVEQLQRAIVAL